MQAAVLLRVRVRLVAGVDDRALQRRLETDLHLEVVRALADLEAVAVTVLPEPDPAGAADHLPADEERRQVAHDVAERGGPADEVVLVGAVRRPLVVGVVLVEQQVALAGDGREPTGVERDLLPRLVPPDDVEGCRALRRGVLRVRMVDVEAGAVGEDHVRQAEVLVGELAGVGHLPRHVEAPGVAERGLLLEVPARPTCLEGRGRIGVHQPRAGDHGVRVRMSLHRDAELGLGAHDPADAHGRLRSNGRSWSRAYGPARSRVGAGSGRSGMPGEPQYRMSRFSGVTFPGLVNGLWLGQHDAPLRWTHAVYSPLCDHRGAGRPCVHHISARRLLGGSARGCQRCRRQFDEPRCA